MMMALSFVTILIQVQAIVQGGLGSSLSLLVAALAALAGLAPPDRPDRPALPLGSHLRSHVRLRRLFSRF
jgi:hypothetical protein